MASKADTWMPFYVGSYLRDTMHLTRDEHGAYLLLIMAAWGSGGRLPNRPRALAAIAKASLSEWEEMAPTILPFFTVDGDELVHSKVVAEREKAIRISEAKSESGKRGGRPRNQTESDNETKPKAYAKASALSDKKQNETPLPSPLEIDEAKASSLSKREREPSEIPDGFPSADDIADAGRWIAEAGSALDAAATARRFRGHAETHARSVANWPAAWRQWVEIEIEKAPKAVAQEPNREGFLDIPPWIGPSEIRAAIVAERGEPFAISWLDRAGWDEAGRAILAQSPFHAGRLRRELEGLLIGLKISVRVADEVAA